MLLIRLISNIQIRMLVREVSAGKGSGVWFTLSFEDYCGYI
ncbi:hypothetical protein JMJ77_0014257, partial [Colletotrichum scovillei]